MWIAGRHVDHPCGWQISPWPARKVTEIWRKRPRDKFGTSQGHLGRLGRFVWKFKFKGENVRGTDWTHDGTDGTCPWDRQDTSGGVSRQTLMFLGFSFPNQLRLARTHDFWEPPCLKNLLMPLFLSRGFSRGKPPNQGIRGNGPLRSENGPLRRGNAPLTLMGSFRVPRHGEKWPL